MRAITIDPEGITLPRRVHGVLTVSFDGHYVWAFDPVRDGHSHRLRREVAWPDVLRSRLGGTARVTLGSPGSTLLDEDVTFTPDADGPQLTDKSGHRLAIDKMGHITRIFAATSAEAQRTALVAAGEVLETLRGNGYDAHLSYGCLLGAVRDGKMIGHDSDIDLAYLSRHEVPADVIRESFDMERALRRAGFRVLRMSGADLKIFAPTSDGRVVHVDIFGAFHVNGVFYQLGGRSGQLPRSALTPASTVTLEGMEFPAPPDPEAVLAFLYGPSWRVPDPAFQNEDPPGGIRRLDHWLRGTRTHVPDWNEFFARDRDRIPRPGSRFAKWTGQQLAPGTPVADIGAGTGRDSHWFAANGHPVSAFDFAGASIRQTRRRLIRAGQDEDSSCALALNDRRSVLLTGAELARIDGVSIYARRLLGSLDDEARDHFWLLCSMALRGGGAAYVEFGDDRSTEPTSEPENLHRRLSADVVVSEIRRRGGHVVRREEIESDDIFGEPDPAVTRIVARWSPAGPASPAEAEAPQTKESR